MQKEIPCSLIKRGSYTHLENTQKTRKKLLKNNTLKFETCQNPFRILISLLFAYFNVGERSAGCNLFFLHPRGGEGK